MSQTAEITDKNSTFVIVIEAKLSAPKKSVRLEIKNSYASKINAKMDKAYCLNQLVIFKISNKRIHVPV